VLCLLEGKEVSLAAPPTRLDRQQVLGFWAAWSGWLLDGMDSFIYALVLSPALSELLPRSGIAGTPANVAEWGSRLFALFLIGWGLSFLWGPIADRFGRTRALAATVLVYSVFTGAAALAQNLWQLALFRFLAGVGVGGEWAMAGTYVAEAWPEDRRKLGAGYLQTGYYFGFFVASALNFTVGARWGWRAMFACGAAPVVLSLFMRLRLEEPARWRQREGHAHPHGDAAPARSPLATILSGPLRRRTVVNCALITVSIIGLWAAAVYEPTAVIQLAKKAGMDQAGAVRMASYGSGLLSIGTILGCVAAPVVAERWGRRRALALYFAAMIVTIVLAFGWAFYLPQGLPAFLVVVFFLGVAGGNFALYSLWLPEQYDTSVRATAFAFTTSFGRFVGAGVNFLLAVAVRGMGTLGTPVALTAVAFAVGLLIVPAATETRGRELPR
jgi:MFS family permease